MATKKVTQLARMLGSKGGRIGGKVKGPSKRRGDRQYYADLAHRRWQKTKMENEL